MTTNILYIDSSPMGERSVSKKLTKKLIGELKSKHPDHKVIYHDFGSDPLPHLSGQVLSAFFTPADQLTPELSEAKKKSDELTEELLNAHILVIGAPMWNLNIPSALKAWIDHIVRAGKTFHYTANGAQGLLKGDKKVIIVSSRGGVYTQGPAQAYDYQETYLKTIFGFLGLNDVSFIRAEGVSMGDESLAKALKTAEAHLVEVVAAS